MNILIIGNGAAGITAAKTLRQKSPDAAITVVTDEKFHYYSRPALIDFIAGRKKESELYFYPEAWYESNKIKVILEKSVEKIELAARRALLDDGTSVSYDKLLISSGARSNRPPIPGANGPETITLRCLEDAKSLLDKSSKTRKIVFIGGGVLGIEAAAAVKTTFPDTEITILEVAPYLLPRQLDAKGGEILLKCLARRGLNAKAGAKISDIGDGSVRFSDGGAIRAGLFVISAGVKPNTEFATAAGIAVSKGIVVNEYLETSSRGVFAAGDCAEYKGIVAGIVPAAVEQSRIAAINIAAPETEKYGGAKISNTLKVAGIDLTTEGDITEGEGVKTYERADASRDIYKKIFLKNGVIVGSICMGDREAAKKISAAGKAAARIGEKESEELLR